MCPEGTDRFDVSRLVNGQNVTVEGWCVARCNTFECANLVKINSDRWRTDVCIDDVALGPLPQSGEVVYRTAICWDKSLVLDNPDLFPPTGS